jgi:F-type H+-transporting ATPase subunit alpha
VEILKQGQNSPVTVEKQVAIIYCGTKGLLSKVPVDQIKKVEEEYLTYLDVNHRDTLDQIRKGNIGDEITAVLEKVAKEITAKY